MNSSMCFAQGRYEIMRNYMPKVGSLGLDMMFRTCTVQVRLILFLPGHSHNSHIWGEMDFA